jgi:predicted phosphodiesterase
MKIQLVSDLHIEFWKGRVDWRDVIDHTTADVLVVAGDLHVGRTNCAHYLNQFAERYEHVVYVPGNHEFYAGLRLDEFDDIRAKLYDNVHLLNPGIVTIGGVLFIGGSLFTNFDEDGLAMSAAEYGIADFRRIPDVTPQEYVNRNDHEVDFIQQRYNMFPATKKVIVTHWLPAMECVHERWKKDPGTNILNKYFANNLGSWISNLSNTTWMFGHTHDSVDMMIGDTRMLCNPFGYINSHDQNKNYNAGLVIDV